MRLWRMILELVRAAVKLAWRGSKPLFRESSAVFLGRSSFRHFEQEQLREVQTLQKYWVQLRHAVRQMYRDRLQRDGSTGKGKKFDLHHLSDLIQK